MKEYEHLFIKTQKYSILSLISFSMYITTEVFTCPVLPNNYWQIGGIIGLIAAAYCNYARIHLLPESRGKSARANHKKGITYNNSCWHLIDIYKW